MMFHFIIEKNLSFWIWIQWKTICRAWIEVFHENSLKCFISTHEMEKTGVENLYFVMHHQGFWILDVILADFLLVSLEILMTLMDFSWSRIWQFLKNRPKSRVPGFSSRILENLGTRDYYHFCQKCYSDDFKFSPKILFSRRYCLMWCLHFQNLIQNRV